MNLGVAFDFRPCPNWFEYLVELIVIRSAVFGRSGLHKLGQVDASLPNFSAPNQLHQINISDVLISDDVLPHKRQEKTVS